MNSTSGSAPGRHSTPPLRAPHTPIILGGARSGRKQINHDVARNGQGVRRGGDGTFGLLTAFDLTLPLDQVAEGYRAMDERRAIKALLGP